MRSRPFQIVVGTSVFLAMLGCFINCAFESFDEHGCEDECATCVCNTALYSKSDASPISNLLVNGHLHAAPIFLPAELAAKTFQSSGSPHFRYRPPDRLYQLYAAYLI
jgi:hypothetical protein